MECIELNWFCKHKRKVRRSQASISINSCVELTKTQFISVSIVSSLLINLFKNTHAYLHHSRYEDPCNTLTLWGLMFGLITLWKSNVDQILWSLFGLELKPHSFLYLLWLIKSKHWALSPIFTLWSHRLYW